VVHYVPLTMSKEGSPHTGQLFLPMPDGSAQLYSLEGIADPPASAGTINVDVGARVRKPILLPVRAPPRAQARTHDGWQAHSVRVALRRASCALGLTQRALVSRALLSVPPRLRLRSSPRSRPPARARSQVTNWLNSTQRFAVAVVRKDNAQDGATLEGCAAGGARAAGPRARSGARTPQGKACRPAPAEQHQRIALAKARSYQRPSLTRARASPAAHPACRLSRSSRARRHDHFDVPALQTREYRLNFYAHREGTSSAEVTFTNERTAEYVSYALVVKATPPALASTIALDGAVRALVSHALDVDNPLGAPVTFAVACDLAEVAVPSSLLVGAQGSALLELGWRPLVKGRKEGTLTLSAPELGVFVHKLLLDSIPAADARTLHFKAGLGGSQLQSFRFTNFVRGSAPTTYKCAVASGGDFELEVKEIAAPPADGTNGSEVRAPSRARARARCRRRDAPFAPALCPLTRSRARVPSLPLASSRAPPGVHRHQVRAVPAGRVPRHAHGHAPRGRRVHVQPRRHGLGARPRRSDRHQGQRERAGALQKRAGVAGRVCRHVHARQPVHGRQAARDHSGQERLGDYGRVQARPDQAGGRARTGPAHAGRQRARERNGQRGSAAVGLLLERRMSIPHT
jgi:hypothetical protein